VIERLELRAYLQGLCAIRAKVKVKEIKTEHIQQCVKKKSFITESQNGQGWKGPLWVI